MDAIHNLDKSKPVDIVPLDFHQPWNKLPQKGLLHKLIHMYLGVIHLGQLTEGLIR